jgi:hypothetical protein
LIILEFCNRHVRKRVEDEFGDVLMYKSRPGQDAKSNNDSMARTKTVGELQEFAVFLESRPLRDLAYCL